MLLVACFSHVGYKQQTLIETAQQYYECLKPHWAPFRWFMNSKKPVVCYSSLLTFKQNSSAPFHTDTSTFVAFVWYVSKTSSFTWRIRSPSTLKVFCAWKQWHVKDLAYNLGTFKDLYSKQCSEEFQLKASDFSLKGFTSLLTLTFEQLQEVV